MWVFSRLYAPPSRWHRKPTVEHTDSSFAGGGTLFFQGENEAWRRTSDFPLGHSVGQWQGQDYSLGARVTVGNEVTILG